MQYKATNVNNVNFIMNIFWFFPFWFSLVLLSSGKILKDSIDFEQKFLLLKMTMRNYRSKPNSFCWTSIKSVCVIVSLLYEEYNCHDCVETIFAICASSDLQHFNHKISAENTFKMYTIIIKMSMPDVTFQETCSLVFMLEISPGHVGHDLWITFAMI